MPGALYCPNMGLFHFVKVTSDSSAVLLLQHELASWDSPLRVNTPYHFTGPGQSIRWPFGLPLTSETSAGVVKQMDSRLIKSCRRQRGGGGRAANLKSSTLQLFV